MGCVIVCSAPGRGGDHASIHVYTHISLYVKTNTYIGAPEARVGYEFEDGLEFLRAVALHLHVVPVEGEGRADLGGWWVM